MTHTLWKLQRQVCRQMRKKWCGKIDGDSRVVNTKLNLNSVEKKLSEKKPKHIVPLLETQPSLIAKDKCISRVK